MKCEYKLRNYKQWMRTTLIGIEKKEVHDISNRKGFLLYFVFENGGAGL